MEIADRLEEGVRDARYATDPELRVGGQLKVSPDDFQVIEVMPYKPMGEGEHVYLELTRSGFTTQQVGKALSKALSVSMRDIGWAGLKDKVAVSTQTFSIRLGMKCDLSEIERCVAGETPFTVIGIAKHRNKIKRGHVAANRFIIRLRECTGDVAVAMQIRDGVLSTGVPNYYGIQRFGRTFSNLASSVATLGTPSRSKKDVFTTSVLQSALFNIWLTERMDGNRFNTVILGDIAKKVDSGGLFVVADLEAELERYGRGEITYTGPMFGYDTLRAEATALAFEDEILDRYEIDLEAFRMNRAPGTRRPAVLRLDALEVTDCGEGCMQFEFSLPSGGYATTILREFTKDDCRARPSFDGGA
jgi:tRNA pseudouridine13 synthase